MAMLWEKIVVTAREFLNDKNINDSPDYNEIFFLAKMADFDWSNQFYAASAFCEVCWKIALKGSTSEYNQLDRLFSPSPIATHANFRGCRTYKTGNVPELGALAVWKRGNSWQGQISIVSGVSEDKQEFDVIEARALTGSEDGCFLKVEERKGKRVDLPFKTDKLNLIGFIYPKDKIAR